MGKEELIMHGGQCMGRKGQGLRESLSAVFGMFCVQFGFTGDGALTPLNGGPGTAVNGSLKRRFLHFVHADSILGTGTTTR